ncbi:hypothetical protein GY45DRAFT_606419 [Cubamyces sp. BRFM 1775]|nr:hypothetical protein GY45DRAFT_606419 [Cubamyces sp. BRFM 1775]
MLEHITRRLVVYPQAVLACAPPNVHRKAVGAFLNPPLVSTSEPSSIAYIVVHRRTNSLRHLSLSGTNGLTRLWNYKRRIRRRRRREGVREDRDGRHRTGRRQPCYGCRRSH